MNRPNATTTNTIRFPAAWTAMACSMVSILLFGPIVADFFGPQRASAVVSTAPHNIASGSMAR